VTIDLEKSTTGPDNERMERCLLYDAMGRVVREGRYRRGRRQVNESTHVEQGSFDLDLSGLPQGFYIATVVSVNGRATMPVVVAR
jgi:hypothetical protein